MNDLMSLHDVQMNPALAQQCGQFLSMLQVFYGDAFDNKYGKIDEHQMMLGVAMALDGLTAQEYQTGLNRMRTEKWCPSLPEFRSWCLVASEWWGVEYAWIKALEFSKDNAVKITTLTKFCWDSVQDVLQNEGQMVAHKSFRELYEKFLHDAKKAGRVQEIFEREKKEKQVGHNESVNHDAVPMPEDVKSQLNGLLKNRHQQTIEEFQKINEFYAENGRYPANESLAEMKLSKQLECFKSDKKIAELLKPYDVHGLIWGKKQENVA